MGLNPGTFLKRAESIITGFGYKKVLPISLYDAHLESDGSPLTTSLGTNPGFDKKGTSSKHTVLTWAADKVVAAGVTFQIPDDYDQTQDELKFMIKVKSAGTTNTPTFTAAVYKNDSATDLAPDATAAISSTLAWVEFDLDGNSLVAGDNITIDITPGAHSSDAIDVFALKMEYRTDLVFYTQTER